MKIAFIVDPLDGLKPAKDSSIAMMREAARRGHKVHALMRDSLCWRDGAVRATTARLALTAIPAPRVRQARKANRVRLDRKARRAIKARWARRARPARMARMRT